LTPSLTLMLQKPRRPQIRGVQGEAVYVYREPWRTKEMRPHTAFPEGKKQGGILWPQDTTSDEFLRGTVIIGNPQ